MDIPLPSFLLLLSPLPFDRLFPSGKTSFLIG
jgi:hypothetical protein